MRHSVSQIWQRRMYRFGGQRTVTPIIKALWVLFRPIQFRHFQTSGCLSSWTPAPLITARVQYFTTGIQKLHKASNKRSWDIIRIHFWNRNSISWIWRKEPEMVIYTILDLTNHQALTYILNFSEPWWKIATWTSELQQFVFVVHHRPGEHLKDADTLSSLAVTPAQETTNATML